MSKTISNLQDIEIKDLLFMKNQKTRIQEREEKIKYLESLFKYTPKTISNNIKSESNIKTNSKKKSNKNKNLHLKLPKINIIDNNTMNSYERMKNYKVFKKRIMIFIKSLFMLLLLLEHLPVPMLLILL